MKYTTQTICYANGWSWLGGYVCKHTVVVDSTTNYSSWSCRCDTETVNIMRRQDCGSASLEPVSSRARNCRVYRERWDNTVRVPIVVGHSDCRWGWWRTRRG